MSMPDPVAAFVAFLGGKSNVTALVDATAIREEPPGDAGAPSYAIALETNTGLGSRVDVPQMNLQVFVRCYGPTRTEAFHLWREVQDALEGDRQRNGFTAAGCRVLDVHLLGGPIGSLNDAGWPMTLAIYSVWISEVPA